MRGLEGKTEKFLQLRSNAMGFLVANPFSKVTFSAITGF